MEFHELHEKVRQFERNRKRKAKRNYAPTAKLGEVFHGVGTCPRCKKHVGDIIEKGGGLAIRCPKCGDVAANVTKTN